MNNKRCIAGVIAAVLLAAAAFSLFISAHWLTVSRYSMSSDKLTAPIRIVQLTDLHNSIFGENNKRLVDKVTDQKPDLILITGDLLNQNEERTDIAVTLLQQLAEIAPVYVSFGNHESGYEKNFGADIRKLYADAGATVLEYGWTDITVNGAGIRLGGLYGYCLPEEYKQEYLGGEKESRFLNDFQATDRCKILMCHMPLCWIRNGSLEAWDIDCVLAGHSHGGQVRFPLIGGLWAPDQGWFPGQMSGIYRSKDEKRTLVLSRGLGSTEDLPRFNNIPEVVVLDLIPGEGG